MSIALAPSGAAQGIVQCPTGIDPVIKLVKYCTVKQMRKTKHF
jgi:hypothetical protein